jgi:hypothetical protein
MSENYSFTFKSFDRNNIDDLLYLFKQDGKIISKEYLINKYTYSITNENDNFIGFLCYDSNAEPAAFVGGMPAKILINDKISNAVQIGDVITNPKFRGKGLFLKTAVAFFEYLKNETRYDLLFAFPNENSSPGFFNKLGWHRNCNLQLFEYQSKTINFYGLCHKFSFLSPIYSLYKFLVVNLIFKAKKYPEYNSNTNSTVLKDSDFFTYKRRYSDSSLIRIFGNYYLIKFIDGIQIDFLSNPTEKKLKRDLVLISLMFGVKKIITTCTSNSFYKNHFINAGFVRNEKIEWNNGYFFLKDPKRRESFCFSISDTDEY